MRCMNDANEAFPSTDATLGYLGGPCEAQCHLPSIPHSRLKSPLFTSLIKLGPRRPMSADTLSGARQIATSPSPTVLSLELCPGGALYDSYLCQPCPGSPFTPDRDAVSARRSPPRMTVDGTYHLTACVGTKGCRVQLLMHYNIQPSRHPVDRTLPDRTHDARSIRR